MILIQSPDLEIKKTVEGAVKQMVEILNAMNKTYTLDLVDALQAPPASGSRVEVIRRYLRIPKSHICLIIIGSQVDDTLLALLDDAFAENRRSHGERPEIMVYFPESLQTKTNAPTEILQLAEVLKLREQFETGVRYSAWIGEYTFENFQQRLHTDLLKVCTEHEALWSRKSGSREMPGRGSQKAGGTTGIYNPEIQPIDKRWAFCVGVNHYEERELRNLRSCVKDAQDLASVLEKVNYTTLALHDDAERGLQPTFENIDAELKSLLGAVQENDLVWMHFAGHGVIRNGEPYLVMRNIRFANIQESGIRLASLVQRLREQSARRAVLTLDACHLGVALGRGEEEEAFIRNAYELAEGLAIIAASTAEQKAYEPAGLSNGLFTHFLLQGLSGKADREKKGFVTVNDIIKYCADEQRTWRVKNALPQTPTVHLMATGDMILVDFRKQG
jgi:hypothetical protein